MPTASHLSGNCLRWGKQQPAQITSPARYFACSLAIFASHEQPKIRQIQQLFVSTCHLEGSPGCSPESKTPLNLQVTSSKKKTDTRLAGFANLPVFTRKIEHTMSPLVETSRIGKGISHLLGRRRYTVLNEVQTRSPDLKTCLQVKSKDGKYCRL